MLGPCAPPRKFMSMRSLGVSMVVVGLAACGDSAVPPDGPGPYGPDLGMNDITMLLPLPSDPRQPVLLGLDGDGSGRELVAPTVFDSVAAAAKITLEYTQFHVVALRFDLCSQDHVGRCSIGSDGELRLVLEAFPPDPSTDSVARQRAVHAIYRIAADDLPSAVAELRGLALLAGIPNTSPLMVNTAVTSRLDYRTRLRAFVLTYARVDRLTRLAMFGVFDGFFETWSFGGADIAGSGVVPLRPDMIIAHGSFPPFDDVPPGLQLAFSFNAAVFQAASPGQRMQALQLLAAIQNPLTFGPKDLRCLACHMATAFEAQDIGIAAIDPSTVPGRYATNYDVSISAGPASLQALSMRDLGYFGNTPSISQRVANETANVLIELNARFARTP